MTVAHKVASTDTKSVVLKLFSVIPHFEPGGLFKPHLSLVAPIKWQAKLKIVNY